MKKSLITLLLLVGGLAAAKPVDMPTARRVAETLLRRAVVDATPATFTHCYLFTGADGKGFALIAGDDCSRPVLAYSATGHFFPTDSSLTTHHSIRRSRSTSPTGSMATSAISPPSPRPASPRNVCRRNGKACCRPNAIRRATPPWRP